MGSDIGSVMADLIVAVHFNQMVPVNAYPFGRGVLLKSPRVLGKLIRDPSLGRPKSWNNLCSKP
jgi:hypothetical protein